MSYRNKHVFVTGAGGFIGSHLVEALVKAGAHVRALVRYTSSGDIGNLAKISNLAEVDVVYGDVRDGRQMVKHARMSEGHPFTECDIIFHLAALIGIPYSYEAPASYIDTNVIGTLNVLEAAKAARCKRVIITSTSEVYGTAQYVPMGEDHPLQAQSPYSASKIAADKLGESYYRAFGLPVITVRPFNTYGPRQSARAIIPTIISQALTTGVVKLGSLTPIRDLLFVTDTVKGFMAAGLADNAINGETINLGTGQGVSIKQLVTMVSSLMGPPFTLEIEEKRVRPEKSEVGQLVADASKAKELLGWEPTIDLKTGLLAVIAGMKKANSVRAGIYVT